MLQITGKVGGTELTGTLYEQGDQPPSFRGAPDEGAPYTWVCDEFYEVDSGGCHQRVDGRDIRVAFESPMPHGFETREGAIDGAKEHIRTQFARIGLDGVAFEVVEATGAGEA